MFAVLRQYVAGGDCSTWLFTLTAWLVQRDSWWLPQRRDRTGLERNSLPSQVPLCRVAVTQRPAESWRVSKQTYRVYRVDIKCHMYLYIVINVMRVLRYTTAGHYKISTALEAGNITSCQVGSQLGRVGTDLLYILLQCPEIKSYNSFVVFKNTPTRLFTFLCYRHVLRDKALIV